MIENMTTVSAAEPPRPAAGRPALPPDVVKVAVVVILGAAMSLLDSTIVNVALRSLSTDLSTALDRIQWVVTGYLLAVAASIPVTGWVAKRVGARRVYVLALLVFTAGSALCGLATSVDELIAFRVVQGLGGGMILPVGQMILVRQAGPRNMARVMSVIGVPIVLAPVFGPTIGGLLLDYASWRWIFFVNVPIGVVAALLAPRLMPRTEPADAGRLDTVGFALTAVGMVALTYGLAEIGDRGDGASATTLLPVAIGVASIAAFTVRALRVRRPLLDMRLYRHPVFSAASLTTFCLGAAMYGGMILMPLYYQTVRLDSPVVTGLLLAPSGFGAALANWWSGRLTERFGGGLTAGLGGLIGIASTIPFALIRADTSVVLLSVAMVARGIGFGLALMPAMTTAYRVLDPSKINDATPQLSVLRQVGGSVGTAVFVVALKGGLDRARGVPAAEAAAFGRTFWWVAGVAAAATVPTALLAVQERKAGTWRKGRDAHGLAPAGSPGADAPAPNAAPMVSAASAQTVPRPASRDGRITGEHTSS